MKNIKILDTSKDALKDFTRPDTLGFGSTIAPVMIEADYADGKWGEFTLRPYGKVELAPTAKVLHYAQEIFEGLKAYKVEGDLPRLFRPEQNIRRFNFSAERMAMPTIDEDLMLEAIEVYSSFCSPIIPTKSGESLYLRPFMFATEENLGIRPSATFKFLLIASPSGSYFSIGTLPVLIEREAIRACSGGIGAAKTGGNYAASLHSSLQAIDNGFLQTLWLDAKEHRYIEEMSGMNFMAVINGEIWTPKLTDTILAGITRDSILTLAPTLGYKVREERMDIDDFLNAILNGECTEAFACGTAAIITPIDSFGDKNGNRYALHYPEGPVSKQLRKAILDIQEGRKEGPKGWSIPIEPMKL